MSRTLAVKLEHGRVAEDLVCQCGYNLRTLEFTAKCPECGEPVPRAERQQLGRREERAFLLKLQRALIITYLLIWGYGGLLWGVLESGAPHFVTSFMGMLGMVTLILSGFTAVLQGLIAIGLIIERRYRLAWKITWPVIFCPIPGLLVIESIVH